MKDGTIPDDQMKASSEYDDTHRAANARLDLVNKGSRRGGWSALYNDKDQWIQVALGKLQSVSGIILQGREDEDQWVTEYQVEYSTDGNTWQYVHDDKGQDMVSILKLLSKASIHIQ